MSRKATFGTGSRVGVGFRPRDEGCTKYTRVLCFDYYSFNAAMIWVQTLETNTLILRQCQ